MTMWWFLLGNSLFRPAGLLLEEKEYTDDFDWEFYQRMKSDGYVCGFISLNGKIQIHLCWAKSVFCIIYQSQKYAMTEGILTEIQVNANTWEIRNNMSLK
jgi:hypothetical protein